MVEWLDVVALADAMGVEPDGWNAMLERNNVDLAKLSWTRKDAGDWASAGRLPVRLYPMRSRWLRLPVRAIKSADVGDRVV